MTDPELVARAIYEVQGAMEGWRDRALAALADCRAEHWVTSDLVEGSMRVAIAAQSKANDLEYDLRRLEASMVPEVRAWVSEAARGVEARLATHHLLLDHLSRTEAAWSGHLERAQVSHQAAIDQLTAAQWAESEAMQRLGAADSRAASVRRGSGREEAQALVMRAGVDYKRALEVRRQAETREDGERLRVERCARALSLARQAIEMMKPATVAMNRATAAMRDGQVAMARVDAATASAHRHLDAMVEAAEEALHRANRASDHLTTGTNALRGAEETHRRAHMLAMDAELDMSDQIRDLMRINEQMGGGGVATAEPVEVRPHKPSSRRLAANLVKSGVPRPPDSAAHHIVAVGAESARGARRVLRRYGIELDDAANGVFLPMNLLVLNQTGARVHSTLHTDAYYRSVNDLILGAQSREEVLDVLAYIRQQLLQGEIP